MPTVPLYNQRVKTAPAADTRLNERATPEAFGAGLGQGVSAVGAVATDFAKQAFDNANKSAILEAQNQYESQVSPITADAKQVRGKDALDLPNTVLPKIDGIADKISQGLANDEQRSMFQQYKAGRRVDTQRFLNDHGAAEYSNYQEQQFEIGGKLMQDRIGQVGADSGQVGNALFDRFKAIEAHAQASGKSPEWVALQKQTTLDQTHAQVIASLAAQGDYNGAQTWYNSHTDQMTAPVRDHMNEVVKQATVEGVSKETAATISGHEEFNTEHPDISLAMKQVKELTANKSQEVQDAAMGKTLRMINQRAAGITDTQNGLEYQILNIAYDSNNPLKEQNPKIGPLFNQLDPVRQEKLRRMFAKPDKAETDAEKYASAVALDGYEQLVSNPDPKSREAFLNQGPPKPGDVVQGKVLNASDAIKALSLWRTAKDSFTNPKAKRDLETLQTKHEAVDEVFRLASVNISENKDHSYSDEQAAALYDWVNREAARVQSQKKDQAPLGSEDFRQIAKQALAKVKIRKMGFFGPYEGETTTGEAARNALNQIPPDVRSKLEDKFFEHEGRRPTANEALQQYRNYLKSAPAPAVKPAEGSFLGDLWQLYG